MFIFLLSTFPIYVFFLLHLERERSTWVDFLTFKEHGLPFIRGVISIIPAILFLFIFKSIFNETFNPAGFYFYYLFEDHFIYITVLTGFYILFVHFFDADDSFLSYSLFSCGFFTVISIITVIQHYNHFDAYYLFLLPILWLVMIFISSCVITRIISSDGLLKILLFLILAVIPFILGAVTYMYKNNLIFLSFSVGIILLISSFFIMIRFKE